MVPAVAVLRGFRRLGLSARANPLDSWRPTPPVLEWMQDRSRYKGLRGPNQSGKTEGGAAELLHRMRGTHPYSRPHTPPIDCWVVCSSWKQSLIIQRKIYALIPPGELDAAVKFSKKNGFSGAWFALRNGSTCTVVTSAQDTIDLASATLHYIWCDEPPPEDIWSELVARVTAHRGTIAITYTPIGRPVDWLREKCEAGEITDHHYTLTVANCHPVGSLYAFKRREAIEEFRRACLSIERAQRCDAAWEGVAEGRVFEAFADHLVIDDAVPNTRVEIGIGVDHGAKAGRQCAVLVATAMVNGKPRAWVLDEARSDGRTGAEDDAKNILQMLSRHGWTLGDVDYWRGARAHSGDWRGNQKSNRDLRRALATMTGLPLDRLPEALQRMTTPKKWQGSVAYGCRLINKMMAEDRLTVSPRAVSVIDGLRNWEGALQDPKKDPIDATRYALEAMIDARLIWGAGHMFAAA